MKKSVLLLSVMMSTLVWGASDRTGMVLTDTQQPIANAVVSDGISVVKTDASGAYTMPYNAAAKYMFVSLPSGYDVPTDETGTPKIWQKISSSQSAYNFTLHRQADGGKADSAHVLIVMGDPQVLDNYCEWRFKNETVEDIMQLRESYPVGTKFIGLTVGDIVWDQYTRFPDQKKIYESMGFPNFMVIGNHDHVSGTPGSSIDQIDSLASTSFENYFGPTYYSFNIGAVHYVVLDNVYYKADGSARKGYACQLTEKQKKWLKNDMAALAHGTQVVFSMHINADNNGQDKKLYQDYATSLGSTCYLMTGHVHTNTITAHSDNLIEHNIGAVQGSYWACDWCADGSPNGYKVFETNASGICNWYYKGTGWDKDFRITTYPRNSINAGNSVPECVLANVWDCVDKKNEVKILVDGVEQKMKTVSDATDPDLYDIMYQEGDDRPNYPGSEGGTDPGKNPGTIKTDHLFYYYPKDGEENAVFQVKFTDQLGHITISDPILRHQMVASFKYDENEQKWIYKQDFDCLPHYPNYYNGGESRGTWAAGHTPKGWYAATTGKNKYSETVAWDGYIYLSINNGSRDNSWLYSYGAGVPTQVDQHSSERALGSLNTNYGKRISMGIIIENNTGATLSELDIKYRGEVWRVGEDYNAKDTLHFSYAILSDAQAENIRDRKSWIGQVATTQQTSLDFVTPDNLTAKQQEITNAAIDGNNSNNSQEINGKIQLTMKPGAVVLLRWDDHQQKNGNDQALAIDDVVITASPKGTALPEVPSILESVPRNRPFMYKGQIYIPAANGTYTILGF